MKATLVLLPLLGITYMLFFVNPGEDEVSRVVFIYFNSFLESFQVPPSFRSIATPALGESDLHSHGWGWFWKKPGGLGEAGLGQPGLVGPHSPLTTLFLSGLLRVCVLLFSEQ